MSNLAKLPTPANTTVSGGITIQSVDDLTRLATLLAKSSYFSDAREASQAATKILCGLELGIPAISALSGIHIVKGKPMISANLMAAAVKRSGKYNYRVLQHSPKICEIVFFEHGQEIGRSEYTAEEARVAGTQNMEKFSKNMLFARAMSNGVKWHCPDVFLGPVYTPEELGQAVDAEGELIPVVAVVEPLPASPSKNPNSEIIKAVKDALNITDRDTLHAIGSAAMDNTFPGKKTAELNEAQLREYLAEFCKSWGMTQGCFKHEKHASNAWNQFINDPQREFFGPVLLAQDWQREVERRSLESVESEQVQPGLSEVPY